MEALLSHPLGLLGMLAVLNVVVRFVLLRGLQAPLGAGAAVMAVGIFALAALQELPVPRAALTRLLALQLTINWAGLALAYALAARRSPGRLLRRDNPGQRFALGTWVAASAVLEEVVLAGVPAWRGFAAALLGLTTLLWLGYMPLVAGGFRHLVAGDEGTHPTGVILLSTVSTQALVLPVSQRRSGTA